MLISQYKHEIPARKSQNIHTERDISGVMYVHIERDISGVMYVHIERDISGVMYVHIERDISGAMYVHIERDTSGDIGELNSWEFWIWLHLTGSKLIHR